MRLIRSLDSGCGGVLYSFSMGKRGQWSRWGRGMCKGWSLELGNAFRGAVVRQDHFEQPATWLAFGSLVIVAAVSLTLQPIAPDGGSAEKVDAVAGKLLLSPGFWVVTGGASLIQAQP